MFFFLFYIKLSSYLQTWIGILARALHKKPPKQQEEDITPAGQKGFKQTV